MNFAALKKLGKHFFLILHSLVPLLVITKIQTLVLNKANVVKLSQRVDLAYLQTGISGVFFGFWILKICILLGTDHSCCIFGGY